MNAPDPTPPDTDAADGGGGFPRWLKWGLLGALAVLVVGYGLIFLYANVLNDSPDELGQSDLDAALAATTTTNSATTGSTVPASSTAAATTPAPTEPTTQPPTDTTPSTVPATTATTAPAAGTTPSATDGVDWSITDPSELGYRVTEVLFGVDTEGVGRTDQITGSLVIDGARVTAAEFVVDVASIESDDSRRDNQFRGRIMSTDEFPTATFVLTEPIELGTEAVEGAAVETAATGQLTLRGVTNPVTFDLTAELANGRIGVLGTIPVVFADYGISNPSVPGITTEDNGLLEFVLVFAPT